MNQQKNFFNFLKGTDIEADLEEALDESSQEVVKHIIGQNFSNDELRSYLEANLDLNEGQKKLVFKFWKAHGGRIMKIIEKPVSN